MLNVKDVLLIPALAAGDESIISGVASLMAELGQAVRIHIRFLIWLLINGVLSHHMMNWGMISWYLYCRTSTDVSKIYSVSYQFLTESWEDLQVVFAEASKASQACLCKLRTKCCLTLLVCIIISCACPGTWITCSCKYRSSCSGRFPIEVLSPSLIWTSIALTL